MTGRPSRGGRARLTSDASAVPLLERAGDLDVEDELGEVAQGGRTAAEHLLEFDEGGEPGRALRRIRELHPQAERGAGPPTDSGSRNCQPTWVPNAGIWAATDRGITIMSGDRATVTPVGCTS